MRRRGKRRCRHSAAAPPLSARNKNSSPRHIRGGAIKTVGRTAAASLFTALMITAILLAFFVLLPLLSRQISDLFREMPLMLGKGQQLLLHLPEQYPDYVSARQIAS